MKYLFDTCTVSEFVEGQANVLARGLVVITSNINEFKRVSGLQVENWR